MQKVKIHFENCYGIKKLLYDFDFSSKKIYSIYAPNGTMKTSFAKTMFDFSESKDSKDLIFPERLPIRTIQDENGTDLLSQNIFVIEPYNPNYSSDKLSTLVVKKELKDRYDAIYKDLETAQKEFIKKLKTVSQSSDCESEFIDTFQENHKETFFDLLIKIKPKLAEDMTIDYEFKYNDVFDKKGNVKKFLDNNIDSLDEYIKQYESLLSESTFFKKSTNTFGTYQANEIINSVKDNSFFDAGHSIELNDATKISSVNEFEKLVNDEIQKILNDSKLKKAFEKIDQAIGKNTELRNFKIALEKNNALIIELKNYDAFKQKVWLTYFSNLYNDVATLWDLYNTRKEELEMIIREAVSTKTDWEKATKEFNERFRGVPFRLEIENQDDVILKTSAPSLKFVFTDSGDEKHIEKDELLKVLSQGEKRALYLLNIVFEIQARKKLTQETVFVIDDIADSFDYKNKYAIIEYLKDIAQEPNFYQIILTHNFDFFRTIGSRLSIDRQHRLYTIKSDVEVNLVQEKYQKNPFEYWIKNINSDTNFLIALIPFVRNLTEYTNGVSSNTDYDTLTELLHIKGNTLNITNQDLTSIFGRVVPSITSNIDSTKVIDTVFNCAETISAETTHTEVNLEKKIVLSIATRLKAEQFMIDKINNPSMVNSISGNQTFELFNIYKNNFSTEQNNIESLDKVNLMTAENIHLNSFMYEPLLDMSDSHLKALYLEIKNLV
ncbi:MAG: hypothetical protein PHW18_04560 [Sulfuricurvum sp.]|uniref:hypothetical protein n=1 Tax=Sulfuricurvum sp. TaxID=2025608 RepID=UPI00260D4678|nr:hypothetical protein [Sulfuricurvum sp.]MDD2828827.1 hypothetical protein [Sulfuricurvum sp.]MDD4948714.1 hypothetical protein [Sulfuricurvum sp.]